MKYSVEPILWTNNQNEDSTFAIYFRIFIDGKRSLVSTGHFILEKFWNKDKLVVRDTYPLAEEVNQEILIKQKELIHIIQKHEVLDKPITSKQVKAIFEKGDQHNFFSFVEAFIDEVKSKREKGTVINYKKHRNKVLAYIGSRELTFEQMDHQWLIGFEKWLRETKGHKGNYIYDIWKTLKTWFSEARKRKIIDIDMNPFETYENPAYVSPVKDYLTIQELRGWEDFSFLPGDQVYQQASLYFLLGAYSGLRVSDWYQFNHEKNIIGDRLRLYAKKNGAYVTMKISTPLRRVLERVKEAPLTIAEPVINRYLKIIAGKLGIKKKISTHTGRHTFAVTICLDNGVSSETAAELMGITLQTFINNYSQVTEEKIDRETNKAWSTLA